MLAIVHVVPPLELVQEGKGLMIFKLEWTVHTGINPMHLNEVGMEVSLNSNYIVIQYWGIQFGLRLGWKYGPSQPILSLSIEVLMLRLMKLVHECGPFLSILELFVKSL